MGFYLHPPKSIRQSGMLLLRPRGVCSSSLGLFGHGADQLQPPAAPQEPRQNQPSPVMCTGADYVAGLRG